MIIGLVKFGKFISYRGSQKRLLVTILPTESCIFKGNWQRPNFIPEGKFFLGYKNVCDNLVEHLLRFPFPAVRKTTSMGYTLPWCGLSGL